MKQYIPYSTQCITKEDEKAIIEVLYSDFLTQGKTIGEFEAEINGYCGSEYAVALSSCTAGLHIVCKALGISEDSLIWTSPNSFVASANCALYLGANIDFIDIDLNTGLISTLSLKEKLIVAEKLGKLPDIIIPVHYAGRSCNMEDIHLLSKEYGFKIIEDAAHSLGAEYNDNTKVGSCKYSNATVFSFHPVKPITTGEGGVITTNDPILEEEIRLLISHGITKNETKLIDKNQPSWYYEMQQLGFHYRMTDLQAALGKSQIGKLDEFIIKRREIANYYLNNLHNESIILPPESDLSGWHLFVIRVVDETIRDEFFEWMRSNNIGVNLHYIPIYRQPYYKQFGFKAEDFTDMEKFYKSAMSIPIHPKLSNEDIDYIISLINEFFKDKI